MGKMMPLGKQINVVFNEKKLVLMILKKCASVTLHRTILESLGHKDLSGKNINRVFRNDLTLIDKYEIVKLDYTKAVWVRNPFDRLVSGWANRIRDKKDAKVYGVSPDISFEDFALYVCSIEDSNLNVHFRQQTFDLTIEGDLVPNVLIHLESLKEGWEKLRRDFNWLSPVKRHDHKTKGKGNYQKYYTTRLVKKVRQRFQQDLKLLGYEF
jgi:hypothetical protein